MEMNKIIKEKRVELKLTQEQVANYLGVSTPAVNKWEKGISYPDILLISPLARLLKVDVNTLMGFNKELSNLEEAHIVNEISKLIYGNDLKAAYEASIEKIREYPNCYKLIYNIALTLQGGISLFHHNEINTYEEEIQNLFTRCIDSDDLEVKHNALNMLISKAISEDDIDQAQALLDMIPDSYLDKDIPQGSIYVKTENYKKLLSYSKVNL